MKILDTLSDAIEKTKSSFDDLVGEQYISYCLSKLTPEKFKATIIINEDGSYTFAYDGTIVSAGILDLYLRASLKNQVVNFEKFFAKREKELWGETCFRKVKFMGKGRYKVLVEKYGESSEKYNFLSNYLSITPEEDGYRITSEEFKQEELLDYKAIGLKLNGKLSVSVAKEFEVTEHNAHSKPKIFGVLGGYEWKINEKNADPINIVFKPSILHENNNSIFEHKYSENIEENLSLFKKNADEGDLSASLLYNILSIESNETRKKIEKGVILVSSFNLDKEKVNAAKKSYAGNLADDVLIQYNDSFYSGGDKGWIITQDSIYIDHKSKAEINLKQNTLTGDTREKIKLQVPGVLSFLKNTRFSKKYKKN